MLTTIWPYTLIKVGNTKDLTHVNLSSSEKAMDFILTLDELRTFIRDLQKAELHILAGKVIQPGEE